jgi:hypothetical protein
VNGRCFDIGIITRNALANYIAKKMHSHPATVQTGPAALAQSCVWLPCQSDSVTFTESDEACTRVAGENVAKFARVNAMV